MAKQERIVQPPGEDARLIARFLEMLAADAGAARNTLAAYETDLRGSSAALDGELVSARRADLEKLGASWSTLARSTVARKSAALRRFFGFLADERLREDDPSAALPRPRSNTVKP